MNNNKIKKITIGLLVLAVLIMSVAYASLSTHLNIGGNASVVASWKVEIVDIREGNKTANAYSISTPTYTTSTASFDAMLEQSTDSIEYIVTIKNSGDIDAKLNSIMSNQYGNNAIIYEIGGVETNDTLLAGEEVDVTVKISINPNIVANAKTSNVTIVFNYIQNI